MTNVNVIIDGVNVEVPAGTMIIRAAEQIGVEVPRFCDHPLLDPMAACRACLVEIEGQPKPQPACAVACTDGMCVKTQHTSEMAATAQTGIMEYLLINHPLDCPVCDKGGECPLQNQAMSVGRADTRFDGVKRTYEKPIAISTQVLLDRERCVLCARCTRFAAQIAGDPFISLQDRGARQQVGISDDQPFDSYFSGNTIQICPVGALTSAKYRFRARPFDLVSTDTACEHCASGCALRTDVRRSKIQRRLAGNDPEVNEEWNCDKGRFAFTYVSEGRLSTPLIRDESGELVPSSWPEALRLAAAGLAGKRVAVRTGGRVTVEDAQAWSAFARNVLNTGDVDFRSRFASDEEAAFLANRVANKGFGVTYRDLESASEVLLVAFEPEDESPIVFLRLRKAARNGLKVRSVAPYASTGLAKMKGALISAAPGGEAAAIAGLSLGENAIVLVGERAAQAPGLLTAVAELVDRSHARLAWIPRRAGDRGAIDAGLLPSETVEPQAVIVGGVAEAAFIPKADFVVSLEIRHSQVTEIADVVLPVASVAEKSGTFRNWEGRDRSFAAVLDAPGLLSDAAVLAEIAQAMGKELGQSRPATLAEVKVTAPAPTRPDSGQAVLATWQHLLDKGVLQEGEPFLAGTARVAVARVSPNTASALGLVDGGMATVSAGSARATLPVVVTAGMADGTVWVPANSEGSSLGLPAGSIVTVGGAA